MHKIGVLIIKNRWVAIGLVSLCSILSIRLLPSSYATPLPYIAAAAIGLVTLRNSLIEAMAVLLGAVSLVLLAVQLMEAKPEFHFSLAFVLWIPTLVCAWLLRITQSQGIMICAAGIFGILLVISMHGLTGDVIAWWKSWLASVIHRVPGATVEGFEQDNTLEKLTGLMSLFFSLAIILSLLLARWWQSTLFYAGGFKEEFHNLRLPRQIILWLCMAGLLFYFLWPVMGFDCLPVAVAIFTIQGIATIHGIAGAREKKVFLIIPLYILLVLKPVHVGYGLAFVGILDVLFDFRVRFKQKSSSQ